MLPQEDKQLKNERRALRLMYGAYVSAIVFGLSMAVANTPSLYAQGTDFGRDVEDRDNQDYNGDGQIGNGGNGGNEGTDFGRNIEVRDRIDYNGDGRIGGGTFTDNPPLGYRGCSICLPPETPRERSMWDRFERRVNELFGLYDPEIRTPRATVLRNPNTRVVIERGLSRARLRTMPEIMRDHGLHRKSDGSYEYNSYPAGDDLQDFNDDCHGCPGQDSSHR